jgi:hypothetical protein
MSTTVNTRRPEPGEYKDYYETYVGKIPETDIVSVLRAAARFDARLLEQGARRQS